MSYSTCFACDKMVGSYEKWCKNCLERYNLKQGDWRRFKPKTEYDSLGRDAEIMFEIACDTDLCVDVALELYANRSGKEVLGPASR